MLNMPSKRLHIRIFLLVDYMTAIANAELSMGQLGQARNSVRTQKYKREPGPTQIELKL